MTASLPQNTKSASQGSPIGQRHLPCAECDQRATLRRVDGRGIGRLDSGRFRREQPQEPELEECRGRRARGGQLRAGDAAGRPGPMPRRWILPMTALRLTPISAAIWLQDSPATTKFRSCSIRSAVQGAGHDSGLVIAAAIWAADRTKAAHNRRPRELHSAFSARNRCAAARIHASRRITEPHPRFERCKPVGPEANVVRGTDRSRFKCVERKPSPNRKIA